jgi:hypothetical protein
MPRLPRLHVPGAMYHVTARGNHRQDIFFKNADRSMLDEIMADALEHTGARFMRSTGCRIICTNESDNGTFVCGAGREFVFCTMNPLLSVRRRTECPLVWPSIYARDRTAHRR